MKEWLFKVKEARLIDALTGQLKLPRETLERLCAMGAVQVRPQGKGAWKRVRDPQFTLKGGDELQVAYEPRVLELPAFETTGPIWECPHYGVFFKPAGIMSQGTAAGDHRSILYAVEKLGHEAYPVHRLDRETEGPMLVAYSSEGAARLSELFQQQAVKKTYQAIIVNAVRLSSQQGSFKQDLDGKKAQTDYLILENLPDGRALVELTPLTGRLHQLRRHLAMAGSGIWGDPKYGKDNKNRDGLKLAAIALEFRDPWTKENRRFHVEASFKPAKT